MLFPTAIRSAAAAVVVFVCLAGVPVFADSEALTGAAGGSLQPYHDEKITLESEKITIDVLKLNSDVPDQYQKAHVKVEYIFENTSDAPVTVTTGFPERDYGAPLKNFTATIQGKKVATKRIENAEPRDNKDDMPTYTAAWHVYQMTFRPGQTLGVTNEYDQYPVGGAGSMGYVAAFSYILDTGASWKGAISGVDVHVNLQDGRTFYDVSELLPQTEMEQWEISQDRKSARLQLADIEPTARDNIVVRFDNSTKPRGCNWKVSDVSEIDDSEVATATSTKEPYQKKEKTDDREEYISEMMAYFPCQAFDGLPDTAWVTREGADPKQQSIRLFDLPRDRKIESVFVRGGLTREDPSIAYTDYARPKKINMRFVAGAASEPYDIIVDIPDTAEGSTIAIDPFFIPYVSMDERRFVDISVLDVYPGTKYSQVAIAEIGFNDLLVGSVEKIMLANPFESVADEEDEKVNRPQTTPAQPSVFPVDPTFLVVFEFFIILVLLGLNLYHQRKQ